MMRCMHAMRYHEVEASLQVINTVAGSFAYSLTLAQSPIFVCEISFAARETHIVSNTSERARASVCVCARMCVCVSMRAREKKEHNKMLEKKKNVTTAAEHSTDEHTISRDSCTRHLITTAAH